MYLIIYNKDKLASSHVVVYTRQIIGTRKFLSIFLSLSFNDGACLTNFFSKYNFFSSPEKKNCRSTFHAFSSERTLQSEHFHTPSAARECGKLSVFRHQLSRKEFLGFSSWTNICYLCEVLNILMSLIMRKFFAIVCAIAR